VRGLLASFVFTASLSLSSLSAADSPVARIGTNEVPADSLRVTMARSSLPIREPATLRKALDDLLNHEALAAEAKRLGYDRDSEVVDQMKRLMVQKLQADLVDKALDRTPPTEADLRSYYDRHPAEFSTPGMARGQVATMLIKTNKAETLKFAHEALERAKSAKFEDVVKQHSDFANERLGGGDTGWLVADAPSKRYPDEVLKALLSLGKPGELAAPVVTDRAVFLVRLSEKRPAQVTPFEQVKPGLARAVQTERRQRAYDALCAKLRTQHGVKVDEAAVQRVAEEVRAGSRPPPAPFRTP
jgi:peptidyl-prolyl cis-trans isomerase C